MIYLLRFLSVRYWRRHRGAFFLSALGVSLGLAVFVAIQVANASVLSAFSASLDAVSGKANLQIVGGAQNGLPDSVFAKITTSQNPLLQRHVRAAAPLLSKTLFSPTINTSLLVLGVDLPSESGVRNYHLGDAGSREYSRGGDGENVALRDTQSGTDTSSFARFITQPRSIALSKTLAARHNLKIGDALILFVGARREKFFITTLLDGESVRGAFGGDFALIDIASAQETFSQLGKLSQIDLVVDEDKLTQVAAALRVLAPPGATVQQPAQRGAQVAGLLSAFQLNLSALSCIALFVGAFLIYNAIAIAVVRRRVEVGTLRAFGASRSQLLRLFLLEAAAIGFVGSIIGVAVGLTLARFALQAVATTVSSLYIAVRARELFVPTWLLFAAPLGGTLLAILAAIPAAWEAAATSPRAAMQRASLHATATSFAAPMALLGAVALFFAWLLSQPLFSSRSIYFGFLAAFCTLSGFALLAPLFTLWGGRAAQKIGGAILGIEGALAGAYLRRSLGRSSLVIAALMVSLAMTIGMNVMVRSFRGTVANWVNSTISADLYIAPATGFSGDLGPGLPPEVVRYASTRKGVAEVDTIRSLKTQIGNQPVQLAANELPSLRSGRRKLQFVQTIGSPEKAIDEFLAGRAVLVSERFKNLLHRGAGETFSVPSLRGEVRLPIVGVFYDYTPNECLVYMPRAVYRKYWNDDAIDGVALYLDDGVSTSNVKDDLARRFSAKYELKLLPNKEIRATVFDTFDQTFAVTYALQLIAILVAAIGIFDTLIALLLERNRELAMLRAIGASPQQILRAIFIEFFLIGVMSWMLGAVAGLCLAWQLISVINRQFFGWTILWSLPPRVLADALVLSLLAALCAGFFPALAATKRNLADALQTE